MRYINRKQVYSGGTLQTTTDYLDCFNYVNGTLSYFPMPEGPMSVVTVIKSKGFE